jgi:nitrogen fixation NifU-like protein
MDDLYREVIIEHYKNPSYNHIRIDLRVDTDGKISEAAFSGHGCAISQASADLLLESIIGKSLDEAKELNKEDILENLGIDLGPVRLKCALLSLKVLKGGIYGLGLASGNPVEDN